MQYVDAKLLKDNIKGHGKYRTLYKIPPENYSFETLMAIVARQIPADAAELDVLVNGPEVYLYPIIQLCQLREISLHLIYEAGDLFVEKTRIDLLRYWTCTCCRGRFSISHSTCPYCGGLGFYLPLPILDDPVEGLLSEEGHAETHS